MKILSDIISDIRPLQVVGDTSLQVAKLTYDSRQATADSCFFAVVGTQSDGHNYITSACNAGCRVVVCQTLPDEQIEGVTYVVVENSEVAMAAMASAFYDHPSCNLKVVGVTGTNGKTTIATLLYDLVRTLGYRSGLISTVVYKIDDKSIESTHTTPDAIRLNAMMREMVEAGCQYCFMECSSHSIVQHRIDSIAFDGALFTNITHDHLDYHKTFIEYIRAKKRLFDQLSAESFAIVNTDDKNGEVMLQNCKARHIKLALQRNADLHCRILEMTPQAMLLAIGHHEVWVNLVGRFNAYNVLTVYGAAVELGFEPMEVLQALSILRPVEGRFQQIVGADGTTVIVDYAHTPDALENLLRTVGELRQKGQRVTVVCGCGGERDRAKRPKMAAIAVKHSEMAIFTSDNPRSERPEDILHDMEQGLAATDSYLKIADRETAIKTAIMLSMPGDIVVIAGKGHEHYQIIGNERLTFNDRECAERYLALFNRK